MSQATFDQVKISFPYMVSSEYASGGGEVKIKSSCNVSVLWLMLNVAQVPSFQWHVVKEEKEPFIIKGTDIRVTPLPGSPPAIILARYMT